MSLLFETIQVLDGKCPYLPLHDKRIQSSRKELLNLDTALDISLLDKEATRYRQGKYKMRLFYGQRIDKIEVIPYKPRVLKSLRIIETPSFDYHLKYADRSCLSRLLEKKNEADDIIISINKLVTDSSYANLAFYDGKDWWTPIKPLLSGTRRAHLIKTGKIKPKEIYVDSINSYKKVCLINAMLDLDELSISVQNIIQ
jgi:4-amino-4-deoxychorismate lyase